MGGSASSSVNPEGKKTIDEAAVISVPEIEKLFDRDPYLKIHETEIRRRY